MGDERAVVAVVCEKMGERRLLVSAGEPCRTCPHMRTHDTLPCVARADRSPAFSAPGAGRGGARCKTSSMVGANSALQIALGPPAAQGWPIARPGRARVFSVRALLRPIGTGNISLMQQDSSRASLVILTADYNNPAVFCNICPCMACSCQLLAERSSTSVEVNSRLAWRAAPCCAALAPVEIGSTPAS